MHLIGSQKIMASLLCPKCSASIKPQDINIEADIAKCTSCGNVFQVSDAINNTSAGQFDVTVAPSGASFEQQPHGFRVQASTRSPMALILIPFTLVWAGFSLGLFYGSQLESGQFDPFMSIFGIPFLIGSIALIANTLMTIAGRVVVSANGYDGAVFTGIGPIGWTKRFDWRDISHANETTSAVRFNNAPRSLIQLEGKSRVTFGTLLNDERRYFVLNCIKAMLSMR